MTKTLTILSVLSAFGIIFLAGMALADEDCFVPMADWQRVMHGLCCRAATRK